MQITVSGDAEFKRYELALTAAADSLDDEMDRALFEAGEDVTAAIRVGTEIYMPSDFDERFRQSLRTDVEQHKPRRMVAVVAWGRGRSDRRDVERMNRGELRHPVHGRVRPLKAGGKYAKRREFIRGGVYYNPWTVTRIRPGFYSDPVDRVAPMAMQRRTGQAMDRVLKKATT